MQSFIHIGSSRRQPRKILVGSQKEMEEQMAVAEMPAAVRLLTTWPSTEIWHVIEVLTSS